MVVAVVVVQKLLETVSLMEKVVSEQHFAHCLAAYESLKYRTQTLDAYGRSVFSHGLLC